MPQLIGLVIVILLVFLGLTVIVGVIYSCLLWGPFLLLAWVVLNQVQSQRIAGFADPVVRGRLASISFRNGKVTIAVDDKALDQYMSLEGARGGVIFLGLAVAIVVMAVAGREVATPLLQAMPREDVVRGAALLGAAIGPFIFIPIGGLKMHSHADWIVVAKSGLRDLLKLGTAPLQSLRALEETQGKIDALMKRVTGTAPPGVLDEANRIMQDNVSLLFDKPDELQQRVQTLLDPARRYLQRLEAFDREAGEARQLHGQTVRLAMNMSHRSLMGLAEDALAMINAAPRFIVSGDFDKAEECLATAKRELQAVLADPSVFSDDESAAQPTPAGSSVHDCYARLRIDRSVTAQQLEDLWKRLRQTYHPDKGIADHHAYQGLREDIEAVARDRGFTLRGVNET